MVSIGQGALGPAEPPAGAQQVQHWPGGKPKSGCLQRRGVAATRVGNAYPDLKLAIYGGNHRAFWAQQGTRARAVTTG